MLFNSFQFLVFYIVAVSAFFGMPHRFRWMFLLGASYYFYMCWNPPYVLIIWAITLVDYVAAIRMEALTSRRLRRLWLIASLCGNFAMLGMFKYSGFFLGSIRDSLRALDISVHVPEIAWLLPVGISFHTFQAVSYTIEVYRKRYPAERHLGIYALYIAFFPQMVSGPIERPGHLLRQFRERKRFEYVRLRAGLELILLGLFKKMIIADSLAPFVTRIYDQPRQFSGILLAIATASFAIQIYCDFSGYSDMAVGLARIMGYDLTLNFRHPYFARSVAEYWRRWHISLTSWFRDYVYVPLGGNRTTPLRWAFNAVLVFLLSGLWHGANWTYVVWGGIHGLFIVFGRALAGPREALATWSGIARLPRLRSVIATLFTFSLISLAFVVFRARSLSEAAYVYTKILRPGPFHLNDLLVGGVPFFELQITGLAMLVLFLIEFIQTHPMPWLGRAWQSRRLRWPVYCAGFYSLVFFGIFDRIEFIYFQF
jgi:D-alanyl-lipoteichoic acid acyltransferase DltB (MBOAT superfamily)